MRKFTKEEIEILKLIDENIDFSKINNKKHNDIVSVYRRLAYKLDYIPKNDYRDLKFDNSGRQKATQFWCRSQILGFIEFKKKYLNKNYGFSDVREWSDCFKTHIF